MFSQETQIELFIDRCAELTSKETTPGVLAPLIASQNLAAFLFDALKGAFTPYKNKQFNKGEDRFRNGPLGFMKKPAELLDLTKDKLSDLHPDFEKTVKYLKEYLYELNPREYEQKRDASSCEDIINFAEGFIRYLINFGFHPSYLHKFFLNADQLFIVNNAPDLRGLIDNLFTYFQDREEPSNYIIYTPRLIGKGGEDRGFKGILWESLPQNVKNAFSDHLSKELNIDPDQTSKPDDGVYEARLKWTLLSRQKIKKVKLIIVHI